MKQDIIIVGFGWSSASFIKNIDTDIYNVKVISPNDNFIYTPLLANGIKKDLKLDIKYYEINNKVNFYKNKVNDVDFKNNKVKIDNNEVTYDFLILSHGSEINTFNIKGVNENCYFLKNNDDSINIKSKLKELPENSNIAVIGSGLTGTEIIGNLIDYNKFNIYAIDGLDLPLSTFKNYEAQYKSNNI